ncbi:50S ribosomal protein L3 [uncultured bacterium]|nr:50S ribosomal protein L3 [uncultured bacterium]
MNAILGKKIGMTQVYTENGNAIPVTVVDVSNNVVAKVLNTADKATHIELGKDKRKITNKADNGNYKILNFVPRFKKVFKLIENEAAPEVGTEVKADIFSVGDKVQVTAPTKGKGFQGVVKRWGFAGGPRTHGASDRERAPGTLGTRTIPGRVFKGKKMGGHMGTRTKTISGLKIVKVMAEENLIAVEGAIPGPNKGYVIIKKQK